MLNKTLKPASIKMGLAAHDPRSRLLRRVLMVMALVGCTGAMVQIATRQYLGYRGHGYLPYGGRGYGYRMLGTAASAAQFGMARMIAASGYANMMNFGREELYCGTVC